MAKRNHNCIWHCGRETKNISRICDDCWAAAEKSRESTEEGYKAWLERKRATAAKATSEARKTHLRKARAARTQKRLIELPTSELLH